MNITVNMGLSGQAIAPLILKCKSQMQRIYGSPLFPEAIFKEPLTDVGTSLGNLEKAAGEERSGKKTARVRAAKKELLRCMRILVQQVERIANQPGLSDDERQAIVLAAEMKVRAVSGRKPQIFEAQRGAESGSVVLRAQGGADANEWHSTTDLVNFSNRVAHKTTTAAKAVITGLTPKVKHAFFHHAIIAGEDTQWEGPIFLEVL